MKNSLTVALSIIIILLLCLVFIAYSAYQLGTSKLQQYSPETDTNSEQSNTSSQLDFQATSFLRVTFNNSTDMIIAEVKITAHDNCGLDSSNCIFQRNDFSLNYESTITKPGGPPLKYINNFTSRQLVSSRTLTKNQTELGQLYFTIPKSQVSAKLMHNSSEIIQPPFPRESE